MNEKKNVVKKKSQRKVISIKMDTMFFFERAVQSLDKFHYDKALRYLRRAVDIEPDNPVNHCNMAGIYSEMGNYKESNRILWYIVEQLDASMTECYFYMANNYMNMGQFDAAEEAIIQYMERDIEGEFLEEAEELIEMLSYELGRPVQVRDVKSRDGLFEHNLAREMLEDGRFTEATELLEQVIAKHPEFLAAHNNLALAYYYNGELGKSMDMIKRVLEIDQGNIHALCNLAIFYKHAGKIKELEQLVQKLRKTYPFHTEHLFKLAMTLGILGEHDVAYKHFKRLMHTTDEPLDAILLHYTAVAACNTKRYDEAVQLWKKATRLEAECKIASFYLSEIDDVKSMTETKAMSYQYQLPFEEKLREVEQTLSRMSHEVDRDPLLRASLLWALEQGDHAMKLQAIQVLGVLVRDEQVEQALRAFLDNKSEDDYLRNVAVFALRAMGADDAYSIPWQLDPSKWNEQWGAIVELALDKMGNAYGSVQQHDLQTLWVDFLTKSQHQLPRIVKIGGWSAALEYLIAKMHNHPITYRQIAEKYEVSEATVRKNVNKIDEVCGLREKMNAILPHYNKKL